MPDLKNGLFKTLSQLEENKTARAIRTGIIIMIPIIIIRSFADLCLNLPIASYQELLHTPALAALCKSIHMLSYATRSYFSVLLAISIGWSFAHEWRLPFYQAILQALLSTSCFLIFISTGAASFQNEFVSLSGVMSCLLAAIIASRLYLWLLYKIKPFIPANIPDLHGIVYAVLPFFAVLVIFIILQDIILYIGNGACLQTQISLYLNHFFLQFSRMPLLAGTIFVVLVHFLWFFGINGHNVLSAINDDYYGVLLQNNLTAIAAGQDPVHIITYVFNNVYTLMGGSGSVLALILAIFICSRQKNIRTIAKISLLPSCFNISEIINFGIPLVWNPIFFLPFLLVPVINLQIAYWATVYHIVPVIATVVNWTTPALLSGYIATGSLQGAGLQFGLLALDVLIYIPFVRFYDDQQDYHFTRLVRSLEKHYQQKELTLEQLRIADFSNDQQIIYTMLVNDLADHLAQNKLYLLYQPQFDAQGHFLGAEALLRWPHPVAGFIYPPLIIALAKLGGLLPTLEQFIFHEACRSIATLEHQLDSHFKISVNITGDSLKYATLENSLEQAIQEYTIDPAELWIEITEQDAIASTNESMQKLKHLKSKGHKLLIDDFGMGHTSVTYLRTNIFDVVKLDGSITRNVLESENNQQIISSLVTLSKKLDLMVIAEFVDNAPQLDKLIELGCDAFQGYLYSKPLPLTELLDQLKQSPINNPPSNDKQS